MNKIVIIVLLVYLSVSCFGQKNTPPTIFEYTKSEPLIFIVGSVSGYYYGKAEDIDDADSLLVISCTKKPNYINLYINKNEFAIDALACDCNISKFENSEYKLDTLELMVTDKKDTVYKTFNIEVIRAPTSYYLDTYLRNFAFINEYYLCYLRATPCSLAIDKCIPNDLITIKTIKKPNWLNIKLLKDGFIELSGYPGYNDLGDQNNNVEIELWIKDDCTLLTVTGGKINVIDKNETNIDAPSQNYTFIATNPANDFININAPDIEQLSIFNNTGQCVIKLSKPGNDRINLAHLPNGVYYCICQLRNGEFLKQSIIKQK